MSTIKCKFCVKFFPSQKMILEHFLDDHLSLLDVIPCLFCDKNLDNFDDLMLHIKLEHQGMDSEFLANATLARETKKQLGNYIDEAKKGASLECQFCFEMFSGLDKLNEHGKKEHSHELNPEFIDKMKDTIDKSQGEEQPICERCHQTFLGVIFTRINNKIQNVCFNCYEEYFGANALLRLTIGTNDDMIAKLRKPVT